MSLVEETEFIDEDTKLCVKRGAAWLDQHEPEWVQKIQLESLSMRDGGFCILGQTYGNYVDGLSIAVEAKENQDTWPVEHGFLFDVDEENWSPDKVYAGYRKLDVAWTEYIKNRRAK